MKELLIVDSLNHEELDPTLTIMSFVKYEQDGFVGVVTIDRPKALNALNEEVLKELVCDAGPGKQSHVPAAADTPSTLAYVNKVALGRTSKDALG